MDTKITKVIALNILLIGLVLFLSGCGNQVYTPEVSPFSPTITITPSLPGATATIPATETQLPPYPKSAENFVKKPSISGAEARKIIVEKGAGEDLKALENWYKSKGIIGSGMSNVPVPVVYQEGGNFNWNLMIKKNNGNFLKFTITSGKEADQLVRAMGMITYLGEKPSFEVSELKDPAGMENLTQQVIWDKSGWSVIGAFQGSNLIAWFNADAPGGGEWVKIQEIVPTATPEPVWETELSNSIDPTISLDTLYRKYGVGPDSGSPIDSTEAAGYPAVLVIGQPISYEFGREKDGTSLYILFATPAGIIRAKIDFIYTMYIRSLPSQMMVSELEYGRVLEIAKEIDRNFSLVNENKNFYYSHTGYLYLEGVGNDTEAKACRNIMAGREAVDKACAFDPSKEQPNSAQMIDEMASHTVLIKGISIKEALSFENYDTLYSEGNIHVSLQINGTPSLP